MMICLPFNLITKASNEKIFVAFWEKLLSLVSVSFDSLNLTLFWMNSIWDQSISKYLIFCYLLYDWLMLSPHFKNDNFKTQNLLAISIILFIKYKLINVNKPTR